MGRHTYNQKGVSIAAAPQPAGGAENDIITLESDTQEESE